MNIQEIREQIQQDLSCLLEGFGVDNLVNEQGITLDELAGLIVVGNFNKLGEPLEMKEVDHTWYKLTSESMARQYDATGWILLDDNDKETIKLEYPHEDYEHFFWYKKAKLRWSWYTSLGAYWYDLDDESRKEIKEQHPDIDWANVRWAYVAQ